ncbi:MAG TPA: response regulator transcription factor [Terriglobales bacterium]|nr:response regulator transcription factor [Terriglobales bacterium]
MAIRILIADDNALVRQALGQALERAGHWEIIEAENGEEALLKATQSSPSLVILDLAMPVMDGMRAARAIRHSQPGIPIILHTLHWSPRINVEAAKAGVRKVVAKSDSASIVAAVEEFLRPEPMGYTATIIEPVVPCADITVIRPAPALAQASAATTQPKPADRPLPDVSGPTDR